MSKGAKISRLLTGPIRTVFRKMSSSKGWQEEKGKNMTALKRIESHITIYNA